MTGLMQTAKPTASSAAKPIGLPINKRIGNQTIKPVNSAGPVVADHLKSRVMNSPAGPTITAEQPMAMAASTAQLATPKTSQTTSALTSRTSVQPKQGLLSTTSTDTDSRPALVTIQQGREQDVGAVSRPTVVSPNANRPANAQPSTVSDGASVERRLNGLLSSDSEYIKLARQQAEMEAASRGLRNSTLGVEAGQRAAIASALPIAQQDAQQQFTLDRDASLQNYNLDQLGYQSDLQAQRDATLQRYNLDQTQYQAKLTQSRDKLLANLDGDARTQQHAFQMQQLQAQFENQLSAMNVEMGHQNRLNYTNGVMQAQNFAMEQISAIYSNPNMTPEQQRNAINQVYSQLSRSMETMQMIFEPLPGVDFPVNSAGGTRTPTGDGSRPTGGGRVSSGGSGGSVRRGNGASNSDIGELVDQVNDRNLKRYGSELP